MPEVLFISSDEILQLVSMKDMIESIKNAFMQLSAGTAIVPQRIHTEIPEDNTTALFMPSYLPGQKQIGMKVVSIANNNPDRNLPLIHALMTVFDSMTGLPLAVMDGGTITSIRTGAASGAATDLLARTDAKVAAIIGAGVQARTQLEAICSVRDIKKAYIFDTSEEVKTCFIREMKKRLTVDILPGNDSRLISRADIICTTTTSKIPVFDDKYIKDGTHINGVGSYKPEMQEIPEETVKRAKVIVDSKQNCLAEAGDIVIPIERGTIGPSHIYAEIGHILSGELPGRGNDSEVTIFKSVGNAVQDLAAAGLILSKAKELKLGEKFRL